MKSVSFKKARERRRLTQKQLADESGVSQSSISKIERGDIPDPKFSVGLKLATTLHVNPYRLRFGGDSEALAS